MYWFKKIARALLNLLPLFAFLIPVFCSCSVSALRYEYLGLPFGGIRLLLDENGQIDFNHSPEIETSLTNGPSIGFEGSANPDSYYDDLKLKIPSTVLITQYNSNLNVFTDESPESRFKYVDSVVSPSSYNYSFTPSIYSPPSIDSLSAYTFDAFGTNGKPNFETSVPAINRPTYSIYCDSFTNGATCPGLQNYMNYLNTSVLPYWYSQRGLLLNSDVVSDDEIPYYHTFSFDDMFNKQIKDISWLVLPLHGLNFASSSTSPDDFNESEYFYTSSNFYQGRSFEFRGMFTFDGSFSWDSEFMSSQDALSRIRLIGLHTDGSINDYYYDCPLRTVSVSGKTQVYWQCNFDLPDDFQSIGVAYQIGGTENAIWHTDNSWRISASTMVTDHDETFAGYFNGDMRGGGDVPGDAANDIENGEGGFFGSLANLFNFSFINPFGPIYDMFSSGESCANISTIASMIHSNETQVCPWFDSTTRSIATPVIGLSSMMLIFGFAVRWLKSSSGNLFEDSANEDIANVGGSGFRRFKK